MSNNALNELGIPDVSAALLHRLKAAFPDKLPREPQTGEKDLARLQGQQEVVDFLEDLHNQQEGL